MKQSRSVLIVEDEQATRDLLRAQLSTDLEVRTAGNGEEALAALNARKFDLMLLDMNLPGIGGLEVMRQLHGHDNPPTVIVVSADSNVASAVDALREGAYDYLVKPFSMDELRTTLDRATERTRLVQENKSLRRTIRRSQRFGGMLGSSPAMQQLKTDIEKIADTRGTVLLTGESGTGKELAARAIHELSVRHKGPYIRINCAAIPESLLEAELFGHEKGAFTNAIARREGMFELAHGGTLLLDEVTEIAPNMQSKLLRVLQEREIMRIGGKTSIKVDVRVIATSNRDLKKEVREGRFKEDLYYRLNVIPLHVAPLRERREDIPVLVKHFVERACAENERSLMELSDDAMRAIVEHPWRGNIRELENCLERSVILCDADVLGAGDLRLDAEEASEGRNAHLDDSSLTLRDMERELILRRLDLTNGNRTRAAEMLGISVRTLRNKINQYRGEGPDHSRLGKGRVLGAKERRLEAITNLLQAGNVPLLRKALGAYALRHRVVADNIANVGTEGYRAQRVDFEQLLAERQSLDPGGLRTHQAHLPIGDADPLPQAKIVEDESLFDNGINNVDIEGEGIAEAQNLLMYNMATRMLSAKYQGLRRAISGQVS